MAGATVICALARLSMCGTLGLLASGCSLSFPIAGFTADTTPTGSIDRASAVLGKELDQEDWRRARSAMAVALDPQGNGASVAWSNPQSGAKGSFVAAAAPFAKNDQVCRAFLAHMTPDPNLERDIEGSACRRSDGDWVLADVKELKKAEDLALRLASDACRCTLEIPLWSERQKRPVPSGRARPLGSETDAQSI